MSDLPRIFRFINRTSLVAQIVVGLLAARCWRCSCLGLPSRWRCWGPVRAGPQGGCAGSGVRAGDVIAGQPQARATHPYSADHSALRGGHLSAAAVAVLASFMFHIADAGERAADVTPPSGVGAVLQTLLFNIADNPVRALLNGNFIGILAWAIGLGFAFRHAQDSTRRLIGDLSDGVTLIVKVVIRFAPLGVFGLVAGTLADSGF